MTLHCRQVISRSDPPPVVFVLLVTVLVTADPPPMRRLRKARGLPSDSRPGLSAATALFFFRPQQSPCLPSLFVRLAVCISEMAERSAGLFEEEEGSWGVCAVRPGEVYTDVNGLFTHLQCFLGPKQLLFVVKRLIRKKKPPPPQLALSSPHKRSTAAEF